MTSGLASSNSGLFMFFQMTKTKRSASKVQLTPNRATGVEEKVSVIGGNTLKIHEQQS